MKTIIIDGVEYNLTPKVAFREGDWLVHKELVGVTCCITQIHAPHYYLTNNNSFIKFGEEDNYRPWTIQDAKDGDVLDFDCGVGIFKNLSTSGYDAHCYCYYDRNGQIETDDYSLYDIYEAEPATKEQRDTLMKAMTDAGYTFNFEKKELKKIEQKPADKSKIKPKFKTGDRVVGVFSGMPYFITEVCDDHYNTESGCIIMFCSQDNFELYEQKPAWSKEDEKIIETMCKEGDLKPSEMQWLKSLKERVQPQPKQEWSEEDEDRMDNLCHFLEEYGNQYYGHLTLQVTISWLKSLRPQNRWKPSEEQMIALDTAINVLGKGTLNGKQLMGLQEQLKKLRGE